VKKEAPNARTAEAAIEGLKAKSRGQNLGLTCKGNAQRNKKSKKKKASIYGKKKKRPGSASKYEAGGAWGNAT